MLKVLGQANLVDLQHIQTRLSTLKSHEVIEWDSLSESQQWAMKFVRRMVTKRIPLDMLHVVRDVRFLGDSGKTTRVEIHYLDDLKFSTEVSRFKLLF